MVLVDEAGTPVRDALLWNDNRSAPQAAALIEELGGPQAWADATGVVPVRELHRHQAALGRRPRARRRGARAGRAAPPRLDHPPAARRCGRADHRPRRRVAARATGRPPTDAYRPEILRTAFGRDLAVPRVAGPREAVGETPGGILLAPGTGDNMGCRPGPRPRARRRRGLPGHERHGVRRRDRPTADPSGIVAGFADATGRFLPLVCTLNAARVIGAALTHGRRRARRPRPARAVRRRHRGPGAAAVPRRRADPRPARRDRPAARPDPAQRDPRPTWSARRSRGCSAASRTPSRRSRPPA